MPRETKNSNTVSVADLQAQIDHLQLIIEEQNQQAEAAAEQIAALQEASAAASAAASGSLAGTSGTTPGVPVPQPPAPAASTAVVVQNSPRIPDLIKMVPEFNGNSRNLPRWLESVEEKLAESKRFLPQNEINRVLPVWLGVIRDKITEKANDALSASHTPLDWNLMKTTLIEYFGDRTDLSTLISRLTTLKQGSQSVTEFYQICKSLLAEINANIMLNNRAAAEARAIMGTYETLMVNAFVDGLHDATSDLTRSTRPQTLAAAHQVASEHEAAIKRRKLRYTSYEMRNKTPAHASGTKSSPFTHATPHKTHFQQGTLVPARMVQQKPSYEHTSNPRNMAQTQNTNHFQNRAIKNEPASQQSRQNYYSNGIHCNEYCQCNNKTEYEQPNAPHNENYHLPEEYSEDIQVEENLEPPTEVENLNFHVAMSPPQEE